MARSVIQTNGKRSKSVGCASKGAENGFGARGLRNLARPMSSQDALGESGDSSGDNASPQYQQNNTEKSEHGGEELS